MADKFSQYEVKGDKFSQYEVTREADSEKPKWESLIRAFSQAATFGFGDEAQAAIRAGLEPGKFTDNYTRLRDEERAANEQAAADNPKTSLAGTVIGALPQGLSMARGAVMGGPGIAGQILGGAKTGAKLGTAQAAGEANLSDPEAAKKAVETVGLNTAVGAALPTAAAVVKPVAKYVGGKLAPTEAETMAALKGNTTIKLPDILSLPGLGALGGAGYKAFGSGQLGDAPVDWKSDPISGVIDTAAGAGLGALGGLGVKYGSRVAGGAAEDAFTKGVLPATQATARQAQRLTTEAPQGKFAQIDKWLHGIKDDPAALKGAPRAAPNVPPNEARKEAMNKTATPEGRASTNSSSDDMDEVFRRLKTDPDKLRAENGKILSDLADSNYGVYVKIMKELGKLPGFDRNKIDPFVVESIIKKHVR